MVKEKVINRERNNRMASERERERENRENRRRKLCNKKEKEEWKRKKVR